MLVIEYSIAPCAFGLGIFTKNHINKGDVVIDADSRLDRVVSFKEIATYSIPMQKHYLKYGYNGSGKYKMSDCLYYNTCDSRFFNHSDTPNLTYNADLEIYVAAIDIDAGKELTCNYNDFCTRGIACFDF